MSSHLLIAVATSRNPNLPERDQRPQLSGVLASVVDLFTKRLGCYSRQLPDLAENPPSKTLMLGLNRWFVAKERDASDWIVLYYTGHADLPDDETLYLLTSDFEPHLHAATAFRLDELATMIIARKRKVGNLLVIVDTCFAGAGAAQLSSRFAKVLSKVAGGSFYVLGAALPGQEAKAGVFAKALISAIDELSNRYVLQRTLFLDQIVPAINQRLRIHEAVLSVVTSPHEEPQFFPNPSFIDTGGSPVAANEAQKAISDAEFREHWGPRARGVEFDSQPGFYFTGRDAVLGKLVEYLRSEEHRTVVVTGRPGAGKSAILARVLRDSLESSNPRGIPPINLALHAKGKSVVDVRTRFAQLLGVEPKPEAIIASLKSATSSWRIIIDALDEAAQPGAIARDLLAPMSGIANVRLVIGTRATLLAQLGNIEVIDIDLPEYAGEADIARYVAARLLRRDEPHVPTPYAGLPEVATRVAQMVARRAYPNFLVARLVAEDLLTRAAPVDPDNQAEMAFPTKVEAAFETYLARFGENEVKVRDVLRPLAFAVGQGLPWDNIWAPLASALSARSYSDADIRNILSDAGAFILESSEAGRSVYRLYHQALADVLSKAPASHEAHTVFTKVLMDSVPRRTGGTEPDWFVASHYVRAHLATHAARSAMLPTLLRDPLYLLAAEPLSLLREISTYPSPQLSEIGAVFRGVVHHLREEPVATAASYLELVARQRSLVGFADSVAALQLGGDWRARWTRWAAPPSSRILAKGTSPISALSAMAFDESELLVALGREDGAVELWDVLTGECLHRWQPEGTGRVWCVELGSTRNGRVLLASWYSKQLGLLNIDTHEKVMAPGEPTSDSPISAMCLAERDGEPVCVTASWHHFCIRELTGLTPVVARDAPTPASLYQMRTVRSAAHSEPMLLSVGDSYVRGAPVHYPTLHLYSLRDLSVLWDAANTGVPHYIEVGKLEGREVAVISQDHWGPASIWSLDERKLVYQGNSQSNKAWLLNIEGQPILLEAVGKKLTSQRLAKSDADDGYIAQGRYCPPASIAGSRFSTIVAVYGRPSLLSGDNEHIRVWDLENLLGASADAETEREDPLQSRAIYSLAGGGRDASHIYAGGAFQVSALDVQSGAVRWQSLLETGSYGAVIATALDYDFVVAASAGMIFLLDPTDGSVTRTIDTGNHAIERICLSLYSGDPIAVITAKEDHAWTAQLWNLRTGAALPIRRTYGLSAGQEDKALVSLAVSGGADRIRFAFASKYSMVMVAEYPSTTDYLAFEEWHFPNEAGDYVRSLAVANCGSATLLAAAADNGGIIVWDFDSRHYKHVRLNAHVGRAEEVCFGTIGGQPVLISGGSDGMVCVWTLSLDRLLHVDVGDAITALTWIEPDRLAVGTNAGVVMLRFG